MDSIKIITTIFIGILMLFFLMPLKEAVQEENKTNMVGFGFMELVYVLSLICIWV